MSKCKRYTYKTHMVNRLVEPLRKWRMERTLTHEAAGALLGVSRQAWFDWEKGRRIPSPGLMIELYGLTDGLVQPNDFYDLPALRVGQSARAA